MPYLLKQRVVTRWNSTLTTLKSISANLDELCSLTSVSGGDRNLLRLVVDLNDSLLQEVVQIFKPFDTATKCLSTDKSPTMHLVVPTKVQMSKHLTPLPSDSVIMSQLKQHLQKKLEQYFRVSPLHFVATLLDPRLKNNFAVIPPEQHEAATTSLKGMVNAVHLSAGEPQVVVEASTTAGEHLHERRPRSRTLSSQICILHQPQMKLMR